MAYNEGPGIYKGPTATTTFDLGGGNHSQPLHGIFRSYWETHGGLAQQGFPLSDIVIESDIPVQYFERAVFEYHGENAGGAYEVLLRRVGADAAAAAGISGIGIPPAVDN